ncbi:hypothetical protein R6Q59_009794 [Mikania micrantha]
MASEIKEVCDHGGITPSKAVDGQQPPSLVVEVADDKNKSPRHPRWTQHETLTLIEGKKVAENRGRRGRRSSLVLGSDQIEPKWDSVASYCKQQAVNRGPVQCRKRWSNMVGDFKKIKAWESQVKQESESYWVMRNDARKENKMPGFFDREVFDVLDGKAVTKEAYKLAIVTVSVDSKNADEVAVEDDDDPDKMEGGNQKDPTMKIVDPVPISEKRYQPFHQEHTQGNLKEHQTSSAPWKESISQEGCKRRRVSTDDDFNDRLLDVLEKNANILNAQIDAENMNCQLDRDQRKDCNEGLVCALNRISDALTKIADKL